MGYAMQININAPCNVYVYNNTTEKESQETKGVNITESVDFHKKLQGLNKKNREVLKEYFQNRKKYQKASRVENCTKVLIYKNYKLINYKTLQSANLCRERLCLNCNSVTARKNAKMLSEITKDLKLKHITLSIKNCYGANLRGSIEQMKRALKTFLRQKKIKSYYQSYEITYNEEEDTYHPHIHLLILSDDYKEPLRNLNRQWAESLNRLDGKKRRYLSCKIREVENNIIGSFELSKYVTKPQDVNSRTIATFDRELKGLHLHQANGIFKERKKKYEFAEEKRAEELRNYLEPFDYELLRYIYNGENYILES